LQKKFNGIMLLKTKGIVIKQTKFSDSGVIVKIFTEELGVQSFFVRGLRGKKSKSKSAMFQPLTLIDMVVSYSENKSLHNIKEVTVSHAYQTVTENMIKRALLFFINELLHKSLREEAENKDLFNWIYNALVWLDLAEDGIVNFHLIFMMQLMVFLGFYPKNENSGINSVFDMQEGRFCSNKPVHPYYVIGDRAKLLSSIQHTSFEDSVNLGLSNKNRKIIIETLTTYYKIHLPAFGDFKSLDVLSVVLE